MGKKFEAHNVVKACTRCRGADVGRKCEWRVASTTLSIAISRIAPSPPLSTSPAEKSSSHLLRSLPSNILLNEQPQPKSHASIDPQVDAGRVHDTISSPPHHYCIPLIFLFPLAFGTGMRARTGRDESMSYELHDTHYCLKRLEIALIVG